MLIGVPLGVANITPVNLDEMHRQAILDAVGNPKGEIADLFIQHIELAISKYHAAKELEQDTKPRHVRKRLNQISEGANKLLVRLTNLDGISQFLIDDLGPGRTRNMVRQIESMIANISEAQIKAKKLPNSRHVDYPTQFLARDIGLAMLECLDLRPTKTRDTCNVSGMYNKCLVAVMEASGRRPNTDMMRVMQAGIALLNATLPTAK